MNKRVYNALRKVASIGADEIITGGLAGIGTFGLARAFGAGTGLAASLAVPAAVVGGYLRNRYNDSRESELRSSVLKSYLDDSDTRIRSIAHKLGISGVDNRSVKELQSDIEGVLSSGSDSYSGRILDDENMKLVNSYLNDRPQVLKTIKDYHKFIKGMTGNRYIVLPKTDNNY